MRFWVCAIRQVTLKIPRDVILNLALHYSNLVCSCRQSLNPDVGGDFHNISHSAWSNLRSINTLGAKSKYSKHWPPDWGPEVCRLKKSDLSRKCALAGMIVPSVNAQGSSFDLAAKPTLIQHTVPACPSKQPSAINVGRDWRTLLI